jgi:hypothetical protein
VDYGGGREMALPPQAKDVGGVKRVFFIIGGIVEISSGSVSWRAYAKFCTRPMTCKFFQNALVCAWVKCYACVLFTPKEKTLRSARMHLAFMKSGTPYLACPDMPNRIYSIRKYSRFILCLFWYIQVYRLYQFW